MLRFAILTTPVDHCTSPIFPMLPSEGARKWDYYDLCLRQVGEVQYFTYDKRDEISDFDYVFVHETFYEALGERVPEELRKLKARNRKIFWVELHEKSIFSGALFLDGFLDQVDLILKHQLLDFDFLKEELKNPENNLAPYAFFGQPNILSYWQCKDYFDFRIDEELIAAHLDFDESCLLDKVRPIMYPFSWKLIASGFPKYTEVKEKRYKIGYSGRIYINHAQRNSLAAALINLGLKVEINEDYLHTLGHSEYFLGLGHIHSSLRTFDTMAYNTVLIHYQAYPYRMWPEFREYETFIPLGNPHRLFLKGGFGFNEEYLKAIAARLREDIANEELKEKILQNQKALFEKLVDPKFICAKLGIEEFAGKDAAAFETEKRGKPAPAMRKLADKPHYPLNVFVFAHKPDFLRLADMKVTYQLASFWHLQKFCNVFWLNQLPQPFNGERVSQLEEALGVPLDALIVFDEYSLLQDPLISRLEWDVPRLLVYVSHDYWCHPLRVARKLNPVPRKVMVLRHLSAIDLFNRLLPGVPKVLQRPGVEVSIFHPNGGHKEYDIILGGSETPDYPLRQRLNRLVRENAGRRGWKVLDLTGKGLMSNPPGNQREYAALLAASKVSPTGSNRGGSHGAKLAVQYFDLSPARAQFDDEFYGLKHPELEMLYLNTAGITPRYQESMACKSLLIADLPPSDRQEWYADKMVEVRMEMSDAEIVDLIDFWVKNDQEREQLCEFAYREIQRTETSEHKAYELFETILRFSR